MDFDFPPLRPLHRRPHRVQPFHPQPVFAPVSPPSPAPSLGPGVTEDVQIQQEKADYEANMRFFDTQGVTVDVADWLPKFWPGSHRRKLDSFQSVRTTRLFSYAYDSTKWDATHIHGPRHAERVGDHKQISFTVFAFIVHICSGWEVDYIVVGSAPYAIDFLDTEDDLPERDPVHWMVYDASVKFDTFADMHQDPDNVWWTTHKDLHEFVGEFTEASITDYIIPFALGMDRTSHPTESRLDDIYSRYTPARTPFRPAAIDIVRVRGAYDINTNTYAEPSTISDARAELAVIFPTDHSSFLSRPTTRTMTCPSGKRVLFQRIRACYFPPGYRLPLKLTPPSPQWRLLLNEAYTRRVIHNPAYSLWLEEQRRHGAEGYTGSWSSTCLAVMGSECMFRATKKADIWTYVHMLIHVHHGMRVRFPGTAMLDKYPDGRPPSPYMDLTREYDSDGVSITPPPSKYDYLLHVDTATAGDDDDTDYYDAPNIVAAKHQITAILKT